MNQAKGLKDLVQKNMKTKNTKFIAVTSGKGGVGKSTISANIANTLSLNGYKVALLDADLGLANLDVILNVRINKNLLDVLKGEANLNEILLKITPNLMLIPGDSGDEILKYNSEFLYDRLLQEASILDEIDFVILDTGAGISNSTQVFLRAADEIIVVTVPDPAAITDAYAVIKIISKFKSDPFMMLNMTKNQSEAIRIFQNIQKVAKNNIGDDLKLKLLGYLTSDTIVSKSIKQRTLFTNDLPYSNPSNNIKEATSNLLIKMEQKVLNQNNSGFRNFFKKIMEHF